MRNQKSSARRAARAFKSCLLVEDDPAEASALCRMFDAGGSRASAVTHVECVLEAEAHLAQHPADVILLGLGLPDAEGLSGVRRVRAAAPAVPLVVIVTSEAEALAVEALAEGAQDYLIKGQIETRSLLRAVRYATERKGLEEALFAERERVQVTLNCVGGAVACTDAGGLVTNLNLVAESLTGWTRAEAAGRPVRDVLRIVDATSREAIPNSTDEAVRTDRVVHLPSNCLLVRRDGREVPIEDSAAPMHDRQGRTLGAVIVLRDVSAAREMALQMIYSAEHDFLTGLPNRMLLNDRVHQAIVMAPRHMNRVAVLFLDLDGFKHINDSLGHPIGDRLLQSIARRLVECVRTSDTVSRQGGDEFVVLLSEIEKWEDAAVAARRILQTLAEPFAIGQHDLHVTTSIGVSVYPDDGLDAEALIKNADTAMYQAKENGRQSYQFFKPAMYVRAVERQSIEEGLRRALERQELALHYQPKVCLRTGRITGAEALVRWNHPTRGLVPPSEFIPVAEDCGLILPIGAWVLREACRQAREWVHAGLPPATMAVNISAIEFRGEEFLGGVFSALEDTGMDAGALELELTESVLMKRAESAGAILTCLRARGVRVAVDDFGTGYSSLSYLRKFPIDALKIDQSFVRQITTTPDETSIVTAVISMGRSLKLRVVAEGVRTKGELTFLRAQHCDEAQGFYFSRPVPAPAFALLLAGGVPAGKRMASGAVEGGATSGARRGRVGVRDV